MNIPFFNIGKSPEKRRNKIFVVANQKGGCGKTTVSVLLANQLVLKHHCRLVVLDADPQRSIVKKHEQDRERWPQLQPLYQVVPCTQLSSEKVNGTTAFMDMGIMVAKENGLDRLPPFYFLPNQFNKNWGRKNELTEQQEFLDYFAKLGTVLPKMPNSAEIQRYSTFFLTDKQREIIDKPFDMLYESVYNEKSKSA